jgi:hypothetical protein
MASTFHTTRRTCPVNDLPCGCGPTEACRMVSATKFDTGPAPADEKRCGACDRSPCQCKVPAREPLLPRNAVLRIQRVGNGFVVEAPNHNGAPLVFQTLGRYDPAGSLAEFLQSHFDAPEDR